MTSNNTEETKLWMDPSSAVVMTSSSSSSNDNNNNNNSNNTNNHHSSSSSTPVVTMTTLVESSGIQPCHNVGVFWDYENLPLPSGTDIPKACQAIIKAISHFGQIRDQRLYFDFGDSVPRTTSSWTAFDSVFDLVNTPKRNRSKETLDKKLISDVWAFAWDNAFRLSQAGNHCMNPSSNAGDAHAALRSGSARTTITTTTGCAIVLISSDGDYAHTLNKLRNRGIRCIVVHGEIESVSAMLTASADVAMSLQDGILIPQNVMVRGKDRCSTTPVLDTKELKKPVLLEDVPSPPPPAQGVLVVTPTSSPTMVAEPQQLNSWNITTTTTTNPNAPNDSNEEIHGKRRITDAMALCKAIQTLSATYPTPTSWISGVRVPTQFTAELGMRMVDAKERLELFRATRENAEQLGWIEHGYRILGCDDLKLEKIIETNQSIQSNPRFQKALRGEDYWRLTERGRLVATTDWSPSALQTTCLFIKNVSIKSSLYELVDYLERSWGVPVVLAQVKPTASSYFWFARIKVFNDADARMLLHSSSTLWLHGRRLEVARDEHPLSILDSLGILRSEIPSRRPTTTATSTTTSPSEAHTNTTKNTTVNDSSQLNHCSLPVAVAETIKSTNSNQNDATLVYEICKEQSGSAIWVDGVKLGVLFKTSLQAKQSTKQRFRNAYRKAWEQGLVELGRKQKHSHIIDAVALDVPSTGYELGIFFRVSSSTNGKQEKSNVLLLGDHNRQSDRCLVKDTGRTLPYLVNNEEPSLATGKSSLVKEETIFLKEDRSFVNEEPCIVKNEGPSRVNKEASRDKPEQLVDDISHFKTEPSVCVEPIVCVVKEEPSVCVVKEDPSIIIKVDPNPVVKADPSHTSTSFRQPTLVTMFRSLLS